MKKAILINSLVISALSSFPLTATAGPNFGCSGKVNSVLIYASGAVNIRADWRNDYTYICNVNSEWNGVSPLMCALWVNDLNTSRKVDADVRVYYYGSDDYTGCADLPTYSNSPAPVYVGH